MIAFALALGCGCAGLDYATLLAVGEPTVERRVSVGGARLDVEIGRRNLAVPPRITTRWVERSAAMVAEYCGGFPVEHLIIHVISGVPGGVLFGQHWRGERVTVVVGGATRARTLATDWVLVHELAHTAFPDLPRDHLWMREGLSTYLETLLRARAGVIDEDAVWRRWVRVLPRGLPRGDHPGLVGSSGNARTYLGGALFWLLVDVELRARSGGRRSVRDVVRAVLRAGGNSRRRWPARRVIRVADEATGTGVFRDVYRRLGRGAQIPDLGALFTRLGVSVSATGEVRYDDDAPLAAVRRAMNARAPVALPPMPGAAPR